MQNRSHAVMAQRHEVHDSLDDFPTPPWATRALCEHVIGAEGLKRATCWEPACNRGHMVDPLGEYFYAVWASDVHDYGLEGAFQHDFLFPITPHVFRWGNERPDWIITNPPFRLAEQFVARGFEIGPRGGTAILVRTAFLEGVGRYGKLFSQRPPSVIAQFTERVPMVKGRLTATGSTATAYCWLVWLAGESATRFVWIPPCRRVLERDGDYPSVEAA